MRKKLLSILLVGMLAITITGCGKSESKETNDNKLSEITGNWYLNRNVAVNDTKNGSLKDLFGDSLNSGDGALILNEDGTFSITLGVSYNTTGNYTLNDNIIKFSNIKDKNVYNEESLKEMEENLYLEYMEYKGHKFMKMNLYDYDFEGYIFFEKNPDDITGSYANDEIPKIEFDNNNQQENKKDNYTKNDDGLIISGYTLTFGTYSGTYKTSQDGEHYYTEEEKIKINNNETITMYMANGETIDYSYTIDSNKISAGNNVIEVIGNNKVKFLNSDVELVLKEN